MAAAGDAAAGAAPPLTPPLDLEALSGGVRDAEWGMPVVSMAAIEAAGAADPGLSIALVAVEAAAPVAPISDGVLQARRPPAAT